MKKYIVLLLIVIAMKTYSQDSLPHFNKLRNQMNLYGMNVLAGWGVASTGVGAVGWATSQGQRKYFFQMNAFWGAVNTGIAFLGYRSAQKNMSASLNADETIKQQHKTEKIFLVNTGLDLAYIGVGAYLQSRGDRSKDDKLRGYGSSILLQGAFLALFDATMYRLHRKNGSRLQNFLSNNAMAINKSSISIIHTLP